MRADFYLLKSEDFDSQWLVACRLLEKAYFKGHSVFVFCNHKEDAEKLDELLWTFREDSFVPHNLQGEGPQSPPPIQIGHGPEPRGFNDILLNMSSQIPTFCHKFQRIMEIVANEEAAKEASRSRYREYRAKGWSLYTHEME